MKTITYTADGVQILYPIGFSYAAEDVFTVYVNDNLVPFEKIDHNHTIKLLDAPTLGSRIHIVCASCVIKYSDTQEKSEDDSKNLSEPAQIWSIQHIDQLKRIILSDIEATLKDFKTDQLEMLSRMDRLHTQTIQIFESCQKLKAGLTHEMSSFRQSIHQLIQEGAGKLQYDAARIEGVANHAVSVANQRWNEVNSLQSEIRSLKGQVDGLRSSVSSTSNRLDSQSGLGNRGR